MHGLTPTLVLLLSTLTLGLPQREREPVTAPALDPKVNPVEQPSNQRVPFPRGHTAATCPRKPGNANWVLGPGFKTPIAFPSPDTIDSKPTFIDYPVARALGSSIAETKPAPKDGTLVSDVVKDGDVQGARVGPDDLVKGPPLMKCSLIANTSWKGKPQGQLVSLPITLYPRIRYAFAWSNNEEIERVGLFQQLVGKSKGAYVYTHDFKLKKDLSRSGLLEFALTKQVTLSLVIDSGAKGTSSGQMGLYHLGA